MRPPLEKMRPGEDRTAEQELFFSCCLFFVFFVFFVFWGGGGGGEYFLTERRERKKKDIAVARLATISATRWTGNKLFLRVA